MVAALVLGAFVLAAFLLAAFALVAFVIIAFSDLIFISTKASLNEIINLYLQMLLKRMYQK
jgi:hypothetical protein